MSLILIGRLFVKTFDYAPDSIFCVEQNGFDFILKRVFNNTDKLKVTVDDYFSEDSTDIAFLYGTVLQKNVIPVNGKNNFWKYIKNKENPFLIADNAKFGAPLLYLINRSLDRGIKNIALFMPECFEEVVLDIFDKWVDFPDSVFDSELFYESELEGSVSWWSKANTGASIEKLVRDIDYKKSKLMLQLKDFVEGGRITSDSYFYCISLTECGNSALIIEIEKDLEDLLVTASIDKGAECKMMDFF